MLVVADPGGAQPGSQRARGGGGGGGLDYASMLMLRCWWQQLVCVHAGMWPSQLPLLRLT
eukprot:366117-Chlamydomonas_euryale.AAC.3